MIKLILKTSFIILLCSVSFLAKAQIGFDYAQYDVGFAAGINQASSADVQTLKTTPSINLNFTYNQSPFINYIFNVEVGRLKGGSPNTTTQRQFENHFSAYSFRVQVQAGELIDYSQSAIANAFKNLYLSSGLGYINNNIVYRTDDALLLAYNQVLPFEPKTNEIFIPVRLGYEFKFFNSYNQPSVKIDLGYQYNFIMGDNLDGYVAGAHNDAYSQVTLGFKFAIGGVTSYRKQIHY
ncbi:hypothetical protein [Mucilaginibacter rubeus]|uniref:Outer membrane protein beta-barrel domain-containing protein n=1 Tax=Mucilaginibacter rubeus TaxID=2027860 RepID=A0A5C1HTP1_9SPHI|nr:hypothetical protein [Mucilaginibacter rubeus]QEM08803.1 hypothetical protein DEO27_001795 [Mucilaginibacter rubeus]